MPEYEFDVRGEHYKVTADTIEDAVAKIKATPQQSEMRSYEPLWRDRVARGIIGLGPLVTGDADAPGKYEPLKYLAEGLTGSRGVGKMHAGLLTDNPITAPIFAGNELLRHMDEASPSIKEQRETGAKPGVNWSAAADAALDMFGLMGPGEASVRALPDIYKPTGGGLGIWPNKGPTNIAARRVSKAVSEDIAGHLSRQRGVEVKPEELSPGDLAYHSRSNADVIRRHGGAEAKLLDTGESSRALMRRASDESPEARQMIQSEVQPRFAGQQFPYVAGQYERVVNWFRTAFHEPQMALERLDALREAAKAPKSQAYQVAYAAGAHDIAHPDLARLFADKSFAKYLIEGQDRYNAELAAQGLNTPGRHVQSTPLAYWDQVKRAMDKDIVKLKRDGDSYWAVLDQARQRLLGILDREVPEFAVARGVAARIFQAGDAFEAGENVADGQFGRYEIERAQKGMSDEEKAIFQAGFLRKKLFDLSDERRKVDILRYINESPLEEEKMRAMLGEHKAMQLHAVLMSEQILDLARTALGNSKTVQFAIEASKAGPSWKDVGLSTLAGGAGLAAFGGWQGIMSAALMYGSRKAYQETMRQTANEVARMLTSQDYSVFARGIKTLTANPEFLDNMRNYLAAQTVRTGQDVYHAATDRPGDTARNPRAMPLPVDRRKLVPGQWYETSQGTKQFTGQGFSGGH